MSPSTSTFASTPALTFERLGVRTLINCAGTYTTISGSRALKQVADAMVEATHSMNLEQDGEKVTGTYRSQYATGELTGTVQGSKVALSASVGYHTRAAHYALKGTVEGDVMSGSFPIGPYNQGQWRAERVK